MLRASSGRRFAPKSNTTIKAMIRTSGPPRFSSEASVVMRCMFLVRGNQQKPPILAERKSLPMQSNCGCRAKGTRSTIPRHLSGTERGRQFRDGELGQEVAKVEFGPGFDRFFDDRNSAENRRFSHSGKSDEGVVTMKIQVPREARKSATISVRPV